MALDEQVPELAVVAAVVLELAAVVVVVVVAAAYIAVVSPLQGRQCCWWRCGRCWLRRPRLIPAPVACFPLAGPVPIMLQWFILIKLGCLSPPVMNSLRVLGSDPKKLLGHYRPPAGSGRPQAACRRLELKLSPRSRSSGSTTRWLSPRLSLAGWSAARLQSGCYRGENNQFVWKENEKNKR